jgi:hypothetical protein
MNEGVWIDPGDTARFLGIGRFSPELFNLIKPMRTEVPRSLAPWMIERCLEKRTEVGNGRVATENPVVDFARLTVYVEYVTALAKGICLGTGLANVKAAPENNQTIASA